MPPRVDLKYIEVCDYKAFAGVARLDLAPLTVVFGANGSGKSALVRLPVLLSAALRPGSDLGPGLPWKTRGMDFGSSLQSFCHGGVVGDLGLAIGLGDRELRAQISRRSGSPAHLPGQWVQSWTLSGGAEQPVALTWDGKQGRYAGQPGGVTGFRGLVPTFAPLASREGLEMEPLAPFVEHLGPRRELGDSRFVAVEPQPVWDVGFSGGDSGRVLASLRAMSRDDVVDKICEAAVKILAIELRVQDVQGGASTGYSLEGRRVGRLAWHPLSELGTGLAHVLPLIVQNVAASQARPQDAPPDVIVEEEPEAHTHPNVHAQLADMLLDTARSGRSKCLIETHSETLILRLQRRVAENPDLAGQISLVYIDDEGGVTRPRAMRIDPDGDVPDWPEGWFDTALREVQEISRVRLGRRSP